MRFLIIMLVAFGVLLPVGRGWTQKGATDLKDLKKPPPPEAKKEGSFVGEIGGKTLEQYIKEITSKDRSKAETAVRTIPAFGAERAVKAVPVMLGELEKHTTSFPIEVGLRIGIPPAVAGILTGLQADSKNADPGKDVDPKLVERAIVSLKKLLRNDSQAIVKNRAAQALASFGPLSRSAVPEFVAMLREPSAWENRQVAAMALGMVAFDIKMVPSPKPVKGVPEMMQVASPLPDAVLALNRSLKDSAMPVRIASVQSLATMGGVADPTTRATIEKNLLPVAQKDPEPAVQIWANLALMSLSRDVVPGRINPIITMLQKSEDPAVRFQAAQALGMIGAKGKEAIVPPLIAALTDPEANVVNISIWALAQLQEAAASAVPALEKLRQDKDKPEPLRKAAEEALESIKGKKKTDQKGAQS